MSDTITPNTVRALLEAAAMTPYLPDPAARFGNPPRRPLLKATYPRSIPTTLSASRSVRRITRRWSPR